MSRTQSPQNKDKPGLELFSDLMLMRFKPKSTEGAKTALKSPQIRQYILGEEKSKLPVEDQNKVIGQKINRILYLQLASRDTVILGNYNQLDMVDLDGLTNSFVDTFHYWSFSPNCPIMDLKVNPKKQLMLIYSQKNLFLYAYDALKKEKNYPQFVGSIQLKDHILFMQFPTPDLIAVFYKNYFEIYNVSDSHIIQKKLEKKYNINTPQFEIFAVPDAIDSTVNIFFQQKHKKSKTFGLWCIEVNLFSENIKQNTPYKIYDIMNSLKPLLRIQNYSKDIIFLNLGQEILLASKGYIVDSVNINIQVGNAFLRLFPQRHLLLHIQSNFVEIYNFRLNLSVNPHRIELTSLDSCEIPTFSQNNNLLKALPIFEQNFALFYEDNKRVTSKGEVFYKFMVSYTVKLQEKITRILHSDIPLSDMSEEKMQRKCDILRKIGLKDEEIYLQIWKRSNQVSPTDYQYLLSTENYKMIKEEIENKMRKTSLKFKQVLKIEESCLQILHSRVLRQQCSKEDLKEYLTCHLLIRKLQLFKELSILQKRGEENFLEEKGFYINIQEYYHFKKIELKQLVLEKISQFLNVKAAATILEIRSILYHFRFVYRSIYSQLLEEIVKLSKNDLINVLIAVPELLPIQSDEERQLGTLEVGVWTKISQNEWEKSMYFSKVVTIHNKQIMEELIEDVWFKRNYLTVHDLIPLSNEEIESQNLKNNSVDIFYFFIEKVIQTIKDEQILRNILHHIEHSYKKFPQHLKTRVLLYLRLYQYHSNNREIIKCPPITFSEFLTLKDYDIFKLLFQYEKVKKNCILKEIEPLYVKTSEDGKEIFDLSLLSYFTSDVSEVSHLKYLLNRVNNEKKQFHSAHQSMYGVLVKAMQMKLKLGSEKDIPIDEVLIYLQNIPLGSHHNREIITDLETIQKISEQSEIFKKMKINMTIRQIIDNYELVMEKLVDYLMEKYKILSINTESLFLTSTYRMLAEIQSLKKNVYGDQNELAFFIYLTKLMEREEKIPLTNFLLTDQYINNYFYIDIGIVENLVQYMYKWKFSENSSFEVNQHYISTLLELLPENNYLRRFIHEEVKFAQKISSEKEPVRYPLSTESLYPRIQELEEIIKFLDNETLCKINIDQIIIIMKRLKDLSKHIPTSSHIKGSHFEVIESTIKVSILQPQYDEIKDQIVYQQFIKTYITKGLIKEAIPLIRKSIQLSAKYDITTLLILVHNIIQQLNEESKMSIIKIISYLYEHPLELLQVIEKLLHTSFTGLESTTFLKEEYSKVRDKYMNYNPQNLIFNRYFLQFQEEEGPSKKKALVKNTLIKLKRVRSDFIHDYLYDFLYIILCFQPYNMAIFLKFVEPSKYKLIRSFFSHLIVEEIFQESNVLELMKRAFYLLLKSLKQNIDIYQLVKKYKNLSLVQEFDYKNFNFLTELEKKIMKNYTAFEQKKNKVQDLRKSHQFKKFVILDKEVSLKQSIKNPETIKERESHQYVFSDSDDDYVDKQKGSKQDAPHLIKRRSKLSKIIFDPSQERRDFYKIAPIKSREELAVSKGDQKNDTPKVNIENHVSNPIDDLRSSRNKSKKYFSKDVRSGFGEDGDQYMNDSIIKAQLVPPSNQRARKKSFDMRASNPNRTTESMNHMYPDRLNQTNHQIKISEPSKPAKLRSVQSLEMDLVDRHFEFQNEPLPDLQLQNKKSQEEKSQQQAHIKEVTSQQQLTKNNNEYIQDSVRQILEKMYKTYSPRLEAEPYSLKALLSYRAKNKEDFPKVLSLVIEQVYQKPEQKVQIALRLLIQIGQKFPQSEMNIPYAEIFQKIAKLQQKYGLDLPIQKILPLKSLFTQSVSIDQLFESIKTSVNSVCDSENIFKIAKLLSIGFKRTALEEKILAFYLQKQIVKLNRQKNDQEMAIEMEKIKGLITKLQVRMLLEICDQIIKKATHPEFKKKLVQIFTEAIKMKVNAKEAREFAARHK